MSGEDNPKSFSVDPQWYVVRSMARSNELNPHSIQEALRMFLQPIKNDDPQLDFYTMYKRETMEYDTEYMQKYNEDLNTTLIFVRSYVPSSPYVINRIPRLVCSPPSALPSSSTSSPSSNRIPPNGPKPISERSSSTSTAPSLQVKTLPFLLRGMAPLRRSSRLLTSCTQAF